MMNFNDLVKANKQNVKNIIRLITKQDNEDLEQEVFVRVWKNVDKYEERGNFKSWVCTIAKNISKDYGIDAWKWFSHKGILVPEDDFGYDHTHFNADVFLKQLNKRIMLIKFLPPKTREDDKNVSRKKK